MKKVLISIKNNVIVFAYKTSNSSISNDLINTNIISNNELVFSDIYIKENKKILTSFIKELTLQYNVNEVTITKIDLAEFILPLLDKSDLITKLYIKEDEPLTYTLCETIITNKHLDYVNCYSLQNFMLELLDNHKIMCESRSEILYISNFMEINNLLKYSNIYYKTNIRINLPLSLEDLKDFEDFCKINKYLKYIHINELLNTELESIIKILIKYNKSNIKIIIHEDINNEAKIEELRTINKKYKKRYKISLTLEYTKEYLDKNIFSQTLVNTLKVCGLIISSLVILIVSYIGISNYVALKEVTAIKESLNNVVKVTKIDDLKEIINEKNEENLEIINNDSETEDKDIKLITNTHLASLLSVNDDVVGEIKVNNTKVDYPVLQASDNKYYLDHNINNEENKNGWIFLDYRNNPMNLDKNNIIYGHNMYYSGVMFGTLYKTSNKSWYTNPENQIITYNTLYENLEFQIFSIYRIPKTSDYLQVHFKDDLEFLDFITFLKKRSIYNFNVSLNSSDTILTLSTCSDNGSKRLVIHAKLIKR